MQEKVLGYTDAVLEELGPAVGRVAEELSGFVGLLEASRELRAVMAGAVASVPVRRNILRQLLQGKVAPQTLALASFTLQPGPGADFVSDISAVAAAVSAKRDGLVRLDEGPLGRSAARERLDGYATGALSGLDERSLSEVEDELFRFMRIVDGNPELLAALSTGEVPPAAREGIVRDLLAGHATAASVRMAAYAARVGRPRDYLVLLDSLVARVAQEAHRRVADVRSASELTPSQRQRLAQAVSRYMGYEVDVRVSVEPGLLGGFVVYVGDTVLDASLRQRLERARELLLAPLPAGGGALGNGQQH